MPIAGISGSAGIILSTTAESQNTPKHGERVDTTPTAQGRQQNITVNAIKSVSPIAFSGIAKHSDQLLSPEEIKQQFVQQQEASQLEAKTLNLQIADEKAATTTQQTLVAQQAQSENMAQNNAFLVQQQEDNTTSNMLLLQQQTEQQDSFSNLTRAREAFAAALKLQANVAKTAEFQQHQLNSKTVSNDALLDKTHQMAISQGIDDEKTLTNQLFLNNEEHDELVSVDIAA